MDLNKIILKVLNNKASEAEYQTLEAWKKESKENIAFLEELANNKTEHLAYKDFDGTKAWNTVDQKISSKNRVKPLFLAAVIALLLTGAFWLYKTSDNNKLNDHISKDEVIQIALKDETKVWLNHNSQLKELKDFALERKVDLQGEAFFDVTSDKDNPFVINLEGKGFAKVIGTSFNLINVKDELDLSVYSGHVEMHVLNRVIDLYKGDRLKLIDGSYVKVKNRDKNLSSWKDNNLIFENTALNEVFEKLENHYKVKFKVHNDLDVSQCDLRSRFIDQSIDEVLQELNQLFKMEYDHNTKLSVVEVKSIHCD